MTIETDFTHDPAASSWIEGADGHPHFPAQNLPLGMFTAPGGEAPRAGMAIGDFVLDLPEIAELLEGNAAGSARLGEAGDLNALLGKGAEALTALRQGVFRLLTDEGKRSAVKPALHKAADCTLHLPATIGDYSDFYSGIHHATAVGSQFRPDNPLLPNYKFVPIGYHGRSSSIRLSGVPVKRPSGQAKPHEDGAQPPFGPSQRLDYELEMAIWIGRGNELGQPIPIGEAAQHIAGISILNDWSARDIQAWEYQPLGPFLAKSFHSTISPWIVTMDALAPFRTAQPQRPAGDPEPLPYLFDETDQESGALGVTMEVFLQTSAMREADEPPHRLSRGPMTAMYWTPAQLVAHHSANGCNLRPGDLLGTGTLTSGEEGGEGSLIELSRGGKQPISLPGGETRTFLADGDEVIMTAYAEREGFARIGLGECRAIIAG